MASPILQDERGYSADFRICIDYLVSRFYLLYKILYIFIVSADRNIFPILKYNDGLNGSFVV